MKHGTIEDFIKECFSSLMLASRISDSEPCCAEESQGAVSSGFLRAAQWNYVGSSSVKDLSWELSHSITFRCYQNKLCLVMDRMKTDQIMLSCLQFRTNH